MAKSYKDEQQQPSLLPGELIIRRISPVLFFYRASPRDANASGLLGELIITTHCLMFNAPIEPPRQPNEISLHRLYHPWLRNAALFRHLPRRAISNIERLVGSGGNAGNSANSSTTDLNTNNNSGNANTDESQLKRKPLKPKPIQKVIITLRDFRVYIFSFERVLPLEEHATIARDLQSLLVCTTTLPLRDYFPVQYAAAMNKVSGGKKKAVKLPAFATRNEWHAELLRCTSPSTQQQQKLWRVTSINVGFQYWPSMPENFVVSSSISDGELVAAANNSSNLRPDFWCWSYAANGASLCRSCNVSAYFVVPTAENVAVAAAAAGNGFETVASPADACFRLKHHKFSDLVTTDNKHRLHATNFTDSSSSFSSPASKTTFFFPPHMINSDDDAGKPESFEILTTNSNNNKADPEPSVPVVLYLSLVRGLTLTDIRRGYDALKSACTKSSARELSESDAKWSTQVEQSWLTLVSQCLRCVQFVVGEMLKYKTSFVLLEPPSTGTPSSGSGGFAASSTNSSDAFTSSANSLSVSSALLATLANAGSSAFASLKHVSGFGSASKSTNFSTNDFDSSSLSNASLANTHSNRKNSSVFSANLTGDRPTTTTSSWGSSDLSAVISALVQICLDPEARTLSGFRRLIAKEFVALGHAFRQRLKPMSVNFDDADEIKATGNSGFGADFHEPDAEAPVFLLFLDCVYQLQRQNSCDAFEYNQILLLFLWDEVLLGTHHEFAFDCMFEHYVAASAFGSGLISYEEIESSSSSMRNPMYDARMCREALENVMRRASKQNSAASFADFPYLHASNKNRAGLAALKKVEYRLAALDFWRACYLRHSWQLNAPLKHMVELDNAAAIENVRNLAKNCMVFATTLLENDESVRLRRNLYENVADPASKLKKEVQNLRNICQNVLNFYADDDNVNCSELEKLDEKLAVQDGRELPTPQFVMHKAKHDYLYRPTTTTTTEMSDDNEEEQSSGRDRLLTLQPTKATCSKTGRKFQYWRASSEKMPTPTFGGAANGSVSLLTPYCVLTAAAGTADRRRTKENSESCCSATLVTTVLPLQKSPLHMSAAERQASNSTPSSSTSSIYNNVILDVGEGSSTTTRRGPYSTASSSPYLATKSVTSAFSSLQVAPAATAATTVIHQASTLVTPIGGGQQKDVKMRNGNSLATTGGGAANVMTFQTRRSVWSTVFQ